MKKSITLLVSSLILGACVTTSETDFPAFPVTAAFETPVMASAGDSADDPAIYIGRNGKGFIAGTDKQSGLYIYNLDGSQREYMPLGTINNVDLRDGFSYRGQPHVLLVASDDETNSIAALFYDPLSEKFIIPADSVLPTGDVSPYGICLGQIDDGSFQIGVTTKAGIFSQYALSAPQGRLTLTKTREFSTGKQTEGCAFDDRTDSLYLAVEEGALSHYPANPAVEPTRTDIASIKGFGLRADLEGVSVYEEGREGGYVLVSSQGNNSYGVFSIPGFEYAGRFQISDGEVDGVSTTDGIAVTSQSTPRFPKGFLVVQDDMDDTSPKSDDFKKQNFKIIDWRDIQAQLKR